MKQAALVMQLTSTIILIACCIFVNIQANAQPGFFKTYPTTGNEFLKAFEVTSANSCAFITDKHFYRVDADGNVLVKQAFQEGTASNLQSIKSDGGSGFWVGAQVFTGITDQKFVLYHINASGAIQARHEYKETGNAEDFRLHTAPAGRFYLTNKNRINGGQPELVVRLLHSDGNILWTQRIGDPLVSKYAAHTNALGILELSSMDYRDRSVKLVQVDANGQTSKIVVQHTVPAGSIDYTSEFTATTDGGYLFIGEETNGIHWGNALMYKTNAAGVQQWEKRFSLFKGDRAAAVAVDQDGYYLLYTTGLEHATSETAGDIGLLKTDLTGAIQWVRAFGGAARDNALLLVQKDNMLMVAAQVSFPGQSMFLPALIKTGPDGKISGSLLPFTLQPSTALVRIQPKTQLAGDRLAGVVYDGIGNFFVAGNYLSGHNEAYYPYLLAVDAKGEALWEKKLLDTPGLIRVLAPAGDGNLIVCVERKGVFHNAYDLFKVDQQGNVLWREQLGTSSIKDIIATSDGGFLLTGTEDVSYVNLELLVAKFDAQGKVQWRKNIGVNRQWEVGRRVIELSSGDFLVIGNNQKEYNVTSTVHGVKISKHGVPGWIKNWGSQQVNFIGEDVIAADDGGFIILGTGQKTPFIDKDLLLMKIDQSGNLLWERSLDIHLIDEAVRLIKMPGEELLITGTTGTPSAGVLERFSFSMVLDCNGKIRRSHYFGAPALQTTVVGMVEQANHQLMMFGTTQEQYGKDRMFLAVLPTDTQQVQPPVTPVRELQAYPNPARERVTVKLVNDCRGRVQMTIMNAAGQRLRTWQYQKNASVLSMEVSIHSLPVGYYFVETYCAGKRGLTRLEIAH